MQNNEACDSFELALNEDFCFSLSLFLFLFLFLFSYHDEVTCHGKENRSNALWSLSFSPAKSIAWGFHFITSTSHYFFISLLQFE